MANTSKDYAYYIEGGKIGLVEKDVSFDNNVDSKEFGPGVSRQSYKSPLSDITDGLEVKYCYSPIYRTYDAPVVNLNKFYVNGWTVIGGYLAFVRDTFIDVADWTTTPESTVTSGSSGDTGGQSLDYIVVGGSSRWNGLHRVQTASADGQLITYTKVKGTYQYWEDQDIDQTSGETFKDGGGSSNLHLADHFSAGDFVFISGHASALSNNGFYKVASISQSDTDTSSIVTVDKKYSCTISSNSENRGDGLDSENISDADWGNTAGLSTINVYKANHDFCHILTNVDVLNDENDEIDLSPYLSKALVYYIKSKLAEDRGDIKLRQLLRGEFKRILEREESDKIRGIRMVSSGSHAIR